MHEPNTGDGPLRAGVTDEVLGQLPQVRRQLDGRDRRRLAFDMRLRRPRAGMRQDDRAAGLRDALAQQRLHPRH